MKTHSTLRTAVAATAALVLLAVPASAADGDLYDAIPDPVPSNLPSLGYSATQTSAFGQQISFDGGPVGDVTVALSSWACETGAWQFNPGDERGDVCETTPGTTFTHPITLNAYAWDATAPDEVGELLATVTETVEIPFRPSRDEACEADPRAWQDEAGDCSFGLLVPVTLSLDTILPPDVVLTVAYDTQAAGESPIGTPGPYNALNVGLATDAPSIGTAGDLFWDATYLGRDAGLAPADFGTPYYVAFALETGVPATTDDCKKGGWEDFGFRNQGQCVSSVVSNRGA